MARSIDRICLRNGSFTLTVDKIPGTKINKKNLTAPANSLQASIPGHVL